MKRGRKTELCSRCYSRSGDFLPSIIRISIPDPFGKQRRKKTDEILDKAMSLYKNPYRGRVVDQFTFLEIEHRYLLYQYTPRKSIKIIYFIDESSRTVYVTDFFGNEMDDERIVERNK